MRRRMKHKGLSNVEDNLLLYISFNLPLLKLDCDQQCRKIMKVLAEFILRCYKEKNLNSSVLTILILPN